MRRSSLFVLPVMLLAVVATAAQKQFVEGIVARVNERIVTTADMRQRLKEREAELGTKVPPSSYPAMVQEAADELCLVERATELKIEVDDKEVDAAVDQLKAQNNIKDDATFENLLHNLGLTMPQLRARLHDTILVNHVLSKELGAFNITEEELQQRYEREKDTLMLPERVHLYHIVFSSDGVQASDSPLVERARRFVAAVRAGNDFLTLVKNETATGGASGGDLGVLSVADLRAEIREAATKLKVGEVSDPIVSPAGVHVIELVEHFAPEARPFAAVKAQLQQEEQAERYRTRLSAIVEELKKRYIVEVHPEIFTAATTAEAPGS
jgi:peptidyl-prolyl cis-trans isomerase SurA